MVRKGDIRGVDNVDNALVHDCLNRDRAVSFRICRAGVHYCALHSTESREPWPQNLNRLCC